MAFNSNQFKQQRIAGSLDLTTNPNPATMSVRNDPEATSTATLEAGEGIKLKDLGASDSPGPPIVGKRTSDVDEIFGVRIYNTKEGETPVGEVCEIAFKNAVVFMEASGALNRGVQVSLVNGTPGQVQAVGTNAIFGQTLDKAADGDIIRVLITADGITEGTT
jgi:hypothetical protein